MNQKGICALLLSTTLLLTACTTQAGTEAASPEPTETVNDTGVTAGAATLAYADEFDKNAVMTFEITADPDEWQAMLDNATAEEYIRADVTINGITVTNVGIRPKGNSSLSAIARDEETDRYSFKIKFDEYVDGQTFLGLDKLVLNNNYSDASSMKEYLSYDIMSYIGIDTALYAYADISVNGETWGLYLAIEDYDGSYKERAKGDEGELYKPESLSEGFSEGFGGLPEGSGGPPEGFGGLPEDFGGLPEDFGGLPEDFGELPEDFGEFPEGGGMWGGEIPDFSEDFGGREGFGGGMGRMTDNGVALIYTDDELESYASIFDNAKTKTDEADERRVVEALKGLSEGTDLESYVDVDAQLRYLAAHTVVVNLDSYSGSMGHNYILYENDGKISMLPWDYNMAFGGFMSGDASSIVNFPIDTPVSGASMEDRPMIAKLLEVPEYLERYHEYLQEIIDGYFSGGQFAATVDALDAMISSYIESDPTAFYSYDEYQTAVTELKKLGTLRALSIEGQLNGTIPSTSEGQSADPDSLIDASSVDMSALGSMGGGMGDFGGRGNRNAAPPETTAP